MNKSFILLLISAFITGCAGTYKLDQNTKNLIQSMSKQEAMAVFHRALDEKDDAIIICDLNINSDDSAKPEPTDYGFRMKAWLRGESKGTEVLNGVKYNVYDKDYYWHQVRLGNVTKIHAQPRKDEIYPCYNNFENPGDYEFMVFYKDGSHMNYGVDISLRDQLMAAFIIWSPQAELKSGMGF